MRPITVDSVGHPAQLLILPLRLAPDERFAVHEAVPNFIQKALLVRLGVQHALQIELRS